MLISKLFVIVFLVQVLAKETQLNSSTNRKSGYVNLSNLQCQCVKDAFCKFEQCRLKAVRRNEAQIFINLSMFQVPVTKCKLNVDVNRKYTAYNSFPFNVTVDACQLIENTHKNPIIHNVYQMFASSTNLNHTCPYYDKNILIQNVSVPYTQYFTFVPSGRYMIKLRWILNDILRVIVIAWIEIKNPENNFFREGL